MKGIRRVSLVMALLIAAVGCGGGGGTSSTSPPPSANPPPGPAALSITTTSLPDGARHETYAPLTVTAAGGTAPYGWSATGLPPGLSLDNATGIITGTPAASGNFSPVVTVTDNLGQAVGKTFGLNVVLSLVLSVSDIGSGSVQASIDIFDNAATATGAAARTRRITGASTTLSNLGGRPEGQAYDSARNTLYVARERGSDNGAILAFDNADLSTTTGNATPARVIQGSGAPLQSPFDLFFDGVNDRLFLADIGLGQILVYDNASTLTNASNPSRIISGGTDFSVSNPPISLYVDVARDILYVVPNLGLNLLVFDGASTRNDALGANRRITPSTSVYQLADVKVDTTGDLAYCTDLAGNSILVFSSAAAANGMRAPVAALAMSLSANEQPQASFQDRANDRLFVTVADRTPGAPSGRVLVFDRLSTLTGAVSPARTITGFTAPSGLTGFYR